MISRAAPGFASLLAIGLIPFVARAQMRGTLATSDVGVVLKAGPPLIRDAELFHISPRPDGVHWDGMEYWDPRGAQGVIFAFHGADGGEPEHRFVLSGLNARATYRLHFEDSTSPDTTVSGRQLMQSGLQVELRQPLSSELIFFAAL